MSSELSINQAAIFQRLIEVLDKRYVKVQSGLLQALNTLYPMATEAELSSDPRATALDNMLFTLSIATSEASLLQGDVIEVLYTQLLQSQSAKNAYDQGWRDRLIDLLAHAAPEQIALLELIVTGDE